MLMNEFWQLVHDLIVPNMDRYHKNVVIKPMNNVRDSTQIFLTVCGIN